MFNETLKSVQPTDGLVPEDESRPYQVGVTDLGGIGFGAEFSGTQSIAYLGTENHPHLAAINPKFQFDNVDLDRLITAAINREWQREDQDPRRGIMVMGPKGTGKTTYLRQRMARQGIPSVEMTWREEMESVDALYTRELVGGETVILPAAIAQAAEGGYPVIINELDTARPGQLVGLNEVIDSGVIHIPEDGRVIHAKRGFQVFATCNSSFMEDVIGEYAGTRTQNGSVMDRFFLFWMDHPTEEQEREFLKKMYPEQDESVLFVFARFAALVRKASDPNTGGLQTGGNTFRVSRTMSRRKLLDWIGLTGDFGHLSAQGIDTARYALRATLTAGMPDNELAAINQIYDLARGEVS